MNRAKTASVVTAALATLLSVRTIQIDAAPPPADADVAIVHVLNRIGFGPRPGDVDRVQQLGLQRYIDQQLHPERIADTALTARLSGLRTLEMSSREIAEQYELPALEARRERKQEATNTTNPDMPPAAKRMNVPRQQANQPLADMSQQKVLRAVYGERQLEEVLVDFWFNHFNVDARKGPVRFLLTEYERDTIRPHVLGRFRDLLEATATSPAMLFYLDNWMSADPNGPHMDTPRQLRGQGRAQGRLGRGRQQRRQRAPQLRPDMRPQRKNMPKGLNENYGRELLELHTLGVDGGYTQKDVTDVARAFTGWSIANPRLGGGFRFVPALHDEGEKMILGHRIKAGGGERDGKQVLDILATHPATARFISTKLARRFISDTPPPALIDRAAAKFLETSGDIRAVMTLLLTSPEFRSPEFYRAKVKTPFDFIVSAIRVTGAEVADARPLVRSLQQLGMPLYQCQPPTGYKDTVDAWVNTGALVNRMNAALALASGTVPGVRIVNAPAPEALVGGHLSDVTRSTIAKASTAAQAMALALGSPEFQQR